MTRTVGEEGGVYIVFGGYVCCLFLKRNQYVKTSYFLFQSFTENLNLKCYCSLWRCKTQIKKEKILAYINEYLKCSYKYYIFPK